MAKPKNKFYVVWIGRETGIFNSWAECQLQVKGFPGAKFKGYEHNNDAKSAWESGYLPDNTPPKPKLHPPNELSGLAVDAACDGSPGNMEYRGVFLPEAVQIFHVGPVKMGNNNLGEFLAIVHALAWQKDNKLVLDIYSDSRTAISWVKNKNIRSKLSRNAKTNTVWQMADRALKWLKENNYQCNIIKWPTREWGEIPADFGRK